MANNQNSFSGPHLLGIKGLSKNQIESLLENSLSYAERNHKPDPKSKGFEGLVFLNLFLEPSTRTRISFEIAAKKLGMHVVNFYEESSSIYKGETFFDTVRTVHALGADILAIRQSEEGLLQQTVETVDVPIINAGDGGGEHPTQALLDAMTIIQKKGKLEGLTIAICGNIAHSRVAKSNFYLLSRMGAKIQVFGPNELMPPTLPDYVDRKKTMPDALKGADIVMMLRVQLERMESKPTLTGYFGAFGLDHERLGWAKPDAIVMHPGPINRGVEISDELANDPERTAILDQVKNGVAVRMAVLDILTQNLRK